MNARANKQGGNGAIVVIVIALIVLLPFVYVLSFGPVSAYYYNRDVPDWIAAVYRPMGWIAGTSATAEEWLVWYVSFWIPLDEP